MSLAPPIKKGFDASVSLNTAKRREKEAIVEALHSKTFGAWANHQLSRKGYEKSNELTTDLADGVKLIHLLQAVYDAKVEKKYDPAPSTEILRVENVAIALELLNKHMSQVQINSKDIVDCNRKLTLGLVYRLIMEHQMLKPEESASNTTVSQRNKAAKSNLLQFCKAQTATYEGVEVNDLVESFYDGKAFCAMVDNMKPGVLNWADVAGMAPVDRLNLAFTIAEKEFGIPKFLDAADLVNPDVDARADEKCLMTYLSEFPLAHLAMLQQQQDSTNLREKDLQNELEKEKEKQKERELERLKEKENQESILKQKSQESDKLRDEKLQLKQQHEDAKKLAQQKREEIKNQNDTIREENKRLEEELKRLKEEIAQLHEEVTHTKSKLIGKLTIVAKEARNLPAVDLGGKSDPYLKFNLENQQFKTKVKKRNLNPKWEQEFEFFVTDRNSELVVTIWDWDRFTKDEFIGQFIVPIAELKDGQSEQKWYSIFGSEGPNQVVSGEVSLIISFKLGKY